MFTGLRGQGDGTIYGKSSLKSVFNALVTIFKIIGAGGEGFYKNARGAQFLGVHKDTRITQEWEESLDGALEDFVRGLDKFLTLQGVDRETISIQLADPKPFFEIAMSEVVSAQRYPLTVMIGQQTGRLASDEDQKQAAKTTKERQDNFAEPALRKFIDRFIELGFIDPVDDYEIVFPDPFEPSTSDKIDMALKLSKFNREQRASGQQTVSTESILSKAGLHDLGIDSDELSESLIDDDEDSNGS